MNFLKVETFENSHAITFCKVQLYEREKDNTTLNESSPIE